MSDARRTTDTDQRHGKDTGVPEAARRGPRNTRALLLAAAGLTLAGTMLVASLPRSGGDAGTGDAGLADLLPGHKFRFAERADDDAGAGIGTVAEPEVCDATGLNAAASYRPDGIPGDAVARIQDRDQLIVGVDQNSYRWGYRDPESPENIVGFDLDLVQAIAESLLGEDPDILYKAIPTAERIPAIQDGDVDMVVRTMSITCERWDEVAFSTAYFETGQQLLAPNNSGITGLDTSLNGSTVCSGEETTAQSELERRTQDLDVELVTRGNHLDCLVAIQLGEADALMTDSALAAGHAAQDPTMRLVGEEITAESYGVAMNLEDEDLVRWVNGVLEDYGEGGELSEWTRSYNEWLDAYFPGTGATPPVPQYRD